MAVGTCVDGVAWVSPSHSRACVGVWVFVWVWCLGVGVCMCVWRLRAWCEQGIGIGICCVATVEALVFATSAFYFRRHKVMSSSSPVFMVAICVGAAIGCVAIFFRLLAPLSESTCALVMWLPTVSTVVVIACLLAKTHRVHRLFTNSSLQKVVVSDRDVAYRIAAVVVPWLGLLAAWQLLAPWVPMQALTEPDERGMQYTCVCRIVLLINVG